MKTQLSILIVDDHPSVLLTYKIILEQQGYSVATATSWEAAVQQVQSGCYDLLVCDLMLDGSHNGFEVIDVARERHPAIASVLLTGMADDRLADEANERGAALLFKPVCVPDLLKKIASLAPAA